VLSFGTAGCNLACKFCQNWDITKSREFDRLQVRATPEWIVDTAIQKDAASVAYTYNDPVIFLEYAVDVAAACKQRGVFNVAVTAGFITAPAREEFFRCMDAVNIDLKAFTERFYWKLCGGHLEPVLDTLLYVRNETDAWLEITTLLIPGENDSSAEIEALSGWIMEHLGPDVPLHFSAFHPDWKMRDIPPTPKSTLTRAREIAMASGLHYVYTGNVHDFDGSSTYCPHCSGTVIGRDWYQLSNRHLVDGCCGHCGAKIAGVFAS
jgi:pyruvate formate lyase activating enzyme